MPVYVERLINTAPQRLWTLTQTPALHQRWDLRFSSIRYLPKIRPTDPQSFEYDTRLGFGLSIRGFGTSAGEAGGPNSLDHPYTSSLIFGSNQPLSLIKKGAGYWRYAPEPANHTRFITSYTYRTRWGPLGWILDRAIFRPLMAWATAWSFDRRGRWAERGIPPETSFRIAAAYAVARFTLAGLWFYEGLFPKLLGPHPHEILMTIHLGIPPASAVAFIKSVGIIELLMALLILLLWRKRWPALVSALAMIPALIFGAIAAPQDITAPFNIVVINAMTAALSVIVILLQPDVISAAGCTWHAYRKRPLTNLFDV